MICAIDNSRSVFYYSYVIGFANVKPNVHSGNKMLLSRGLFSICFITPYQYDSRSEQLLQYSMLKSRGRSYVHGPNNQHVIASTLVKLHVAMMFYASNRRPMKLILYIAKITSFIAD